MKLRRALSGRATVVFVYHHGAQQKEQVYKWYAWMIEVPSHLQIKQQTSKQIS